MKESRIPYTLVQGAKYKPWNVLLHQMPIRFGTLFECYGLLCEQNGSFCDQFGSLLARYALLTIDVCFVNSSHVRRVKLIRIENPASDGSFNFD